MPPDPPPTAQGAFEAWWAQFPQAKSDEPTRKANARSAWNAGYLAGATALRAQAVTIAQAACPQAKEPCGNCEGERIAEQIVALPVESAERT